MPKGLSKKDKEKTKGSTSWQEWRIPWPHDSVAKLVIMLVQRWSPFKDNCILYMCAHNHLVYWQSHPILKHLSVGVIILGLIFLSCYVQPSGRCYSKLNYNCVSFPWFTLINELSTDRGLLISLSSKGSLSLSHIFVRWFRRGECGAMAKSGMSLFIYFYSYHMD